MEKITKAYLKGRLDMIFIKSPEQTELVTMSATDYDTLLLYRIHVSNEISWGQLSNLRNDLYYLCDNGYSDFSICIGYDEVLYISFQMPSLKFTEFYREQQ